MGFAKKMHNSFVQLKRFYHRKRNCQPSIYVYWVTIEVNKKPISKYVSRILTTYH